MKTAISIPDDLFTAADSQAEKMGLSRSQFYQRAIRQFLSQQGQDAITAALNHVYKEQEDSGKLDSAIEYLQGASLVHDVENDEW